jgi:hypothetical protein
MMEMKTVLFRVLQRFEMTPVTEMEVIQTNGLRPKDDTLVIAFKRI